MLRDFTGPAGIITAAMLLAVIVALILIMRHRRRVDPELRTTEDGRLSWRIAIGFVLTIPAVILLAWIAEHID